MRALALAIAIMLASAQANAAIYVLQCTTSCIASDGTTQPSGTNLQKILWDGSTPYTPPAGLTAIPYTNQTIYAPAPVAATSIPVWQFFQRFTTAEFNGLVANSVAAGIIAKLNAYGQQGVGIVVADPVITGYMQQAVTASLLTSARRDQILNLSIASP